MVTVRLAIWITTGMVSLNTSTIQEWCRTLGLQIYHFTIHITSILKLVWLHKSTNCCHHPVIQILHHLGKQSSKPKGVFITSYAPWNVLHSCPKTFILHPLWKRWVSVLTKIIRSFFCKWFLGMIQSITISHPRNSAPVQLRKMSYQRVITLSSTVVIVIFIIMTINYHDDYYSIQFIPFLMGYTMVTMLCRVIPGFTRFYHVIPCSTSLDWFSKGVHAVINLSEQ